MAVAPLNHILLIVGQRTSVSEYQVMTIKKNSCKMQKIHRLLNDADTRIILISHQQELMKCIEGTRNSKTIIIGSKSNNINPEECKTKTKKKLNKTDLSSPESSHHRQ